MRQPSLCFVAPQALPVLLDAGSDAGASNGGMGGSELQQVLIGRALTRRGFEVSFIVGPTSDRSATPPASIDGMRILSCPLRSGRAERAQPEAPAAKAWRVARDTRSLYRSMAASDADVYSVRSNHLVAVLVAAWCRAHGKSFVFAAGHDGNCDLALAHRRPHCAVKLAYAPALRRAEAVVVQCETQRRMMLGRLGVRSLVIPNAVGLDRPLRDRSRGGVLWIGTIEPRKGADRLLDIAAAMTDTEFTMVGGPGDHYHHHYYVRCRSRAASLSNVRWLGPRPHREVLDLVSRAEVFLCTSRSEGFPNTFLESWSFGTPVVSMQIDPDGTLSRLGAGVLSGDDRDTIVTLRDLLFSRSRRALLAARARAHVEQHHALETVAGRWESLITAVA